MKNDNKATDTPPNTSPGKCIPTYTLHIAKHPPASTISIPTLKRDFKIGIDKPNTAAVEFEGNEESVGA